MKLTSIVTMLVVWVVSACAELPVELKAKVLSPSTATQLSTAEGWAVAMDGVRIVTGAISVNITEFSEGAAHVYDAVTGERLITLPNPTPGNSDQFGNAVAVSGTRVVVGAMKDDTGAIDAGSAYVFDLSGPTPTVPIAILNNPVPTAQSYFGCSVAISGATVAVGNLQGGAGSGGIVYVYDLASSTPTKPVLVLNNPKPAVVDDFGRSVAISGSRVAVGAPAASLSGSSKVF